MRIVPSKRGGVVALILAFSAAAAASGADRASKFDRALQALESNGTQGRIQVIVRSASAACVALRNRFEIGSRRLQAEHPTIGAVSLDVDVADLAGLSADPGVESVSLDAPVSAHETTTTVSAPVTLDVLRTVVGTNLPYKGNKIGVAVIDSGLANVPDLHSGRSMTSPRVAGRSRPTTITATARTWRQRLAAAANRTRFSIVGSRRRSS